MDYYRIITFISLFLALGATAQPVTVPNQGFEESKESTALFQWKLSSSVADSSPVHLNIEKSHSGKNSLEVIHVEMAQSTITSGALNMEVGQLYKLSGWIKTQKVFSDPTDRYPTSVGACLTMTSFPLTNNTTPVGATSDWLKSEAFFIATKSVDHVRLHLGWNGDAKGSVLFDDIQLEKVVDISEYIPMETVVWCDKGFRYDDLGWIYLHIEGKPYPRGYQHGFLMAKEIISYMNKLAIQANEADPERGWDDIRFMADAMMLRKYDPEYLEEMKGIADGVAKSGNEFKGRSVNFIDIVTLNSYIDLDSARDALIRTAHPLSGRNYFTAEDELDIPEKNHKCSGFLANGPASSDGKIVFGQIFMWGGYTGPHWNVICDMQPEKGNRLVYETYPGGIHSGADFYMNSAGIMIGETTVWPQTPFDLDGTPQSFRIRKAAQYASSIDEVVEILSYKNNGMYSNDWLIGDVKTNETAIFLLGTKKSKLWRSSQNDFPGGTEGFYWSNNNAKDMDIRKEYVPNADNAPFDICYTPWNRDLSFYSFYQKNKGKIDSIAGVNLWNSAPINRPHACDGKITTSEMAEKLVFLAHSGKVTLREKFVGENRRIPDLPGAEPRLSLGYTAFSPMFIGDQIHKYDSKFAPDKEAEEFENDFEEIESLLTFDRRKLWHNTVYPEQEQDNWFVSGTAMYWNILHGMPEEGEEESYAYLTDKFEELNSRLQYVISREGTIAPLDTKRIYNQYRFYQIPRIKGTFLLHQLRLKWGSETFGKMMNLIHQKFNQKTFSTQEFIAIATNTEKNIKPFINQWLERSDMPNISIHAEQRKTKKGWKLTLEVNQNADAYHFFTDLKIVSKESVVHLLEITKKKETFTFQLKYKVRSVEVNPGNHVPMANPGFYTMGSYYDDFHNTIIAYGTKRQIEANHTLGQRFATLLADRVSESLPDVRKECELEEDELASSDLILLGSSSDNSLVQSMKELLSETYGLKLGKNFFSWQGKTYASSDDGLFLAIPNPYNTKKFAMVFIANSALELHHMTQNYNKMPAWAIFKRDKVVEKGYHGMSSMKVDLAVSTSRIP